MQDKLDSSSTNFGLRLRAHVEGRGSVEEAYSAIGVSRATLFNWFQRKKAPPGKTKIDKLRRYLDSEADWVLYGRMPGLTEAASFGGPQFREYLEFIRRCREEAERLGQGDHAKTVELFDKMLAASMHFNTRPETIEERVKRLLPEVLEAQRQMEEREAKAHADQESKRGHGRTG